MVRKISIIGTVLGILAISWGLMEFLGGQKEESKKPVVAEVKRYVQTSKVAYEDIATEVAVYGRVVSALPLDITSEVQGRILQGNIPLREGQRFSKGSLLFKIDQTEREYTIKGLKSSFMRDVATILPDFKIDFNGSYATWLQYFQSIDVEKPLPELPKPKSDQEKTYLATKNILNSYYNIKSQEANMAKSEVYAPFSGSITQVMTQIGSFVNPGSKVAKLVQTSSLELKLAVETKDIRWIKQGSAVNVTTENGELWQGRVVRIGNTLNPNTQALDVFVKLSNGKDPIYEGMYLQASIPGSKVDNVMEVPRAALFADNQVYTVQDSSLKVRPVKVHKVNGETAIISGLKVDEDLVVEPLISAYEDMKIFKISDRKQEGIATEAPKKDANKNKKAKGDLASAQ